MLWWYSMLEAKQIAMTEWQSRPTKWTLISLNFCTKNTLHFDAVFFVIFLKVCRVFCTFLPWFFTVPTHNSRNTLLLMRQLTHAAVAGIIGHSAVLVLCYCRWTHASLLVKSRTDTVKGNRPNKPICDSLCVKLLLLNTEQLYNVKT